MAELRAITTDGFPDIDRPAQLDAAPMLQWIKVGELVVDEGYQRGILRAGRRNVLAIARGFSWAKFAPVVVAPVEGGRYAVIDGQHRSTAAALIGIESVPCQVVIADATMQAEAFAAINGQTTPITPLAVHKAKIAAGDSDALAIEDTAKRAGVKILSYVKPTCDHKPGETLAIGTIQRMLRQHGRDHLITALQCVTETGDGNAGLLVSTVIKGMCTALERAPGWRDAGGRLFDVLDDLDMLTALDRSQSRQQRGGGSSAEAFALTVLRHLSQHDGGDQS